MPASPPMAAWRSGRAAMARPDAAMRFSTASQQAISSEPKYRTSTNPASRPPPDDPTASHRYTEPVASPAEVVAAVA